MTQISKPSKRNYIIGLNKRDAIKMMSLATVERASSMTYEIMGCQIHQYPIE